MNKDFERGFDGDHVKQLHNVQLVIFCIQIEYEAHLSNLLQLKMLQQIVAKNCLQISEMQLDT